MNSGLSLLRLAGAAAFLAPIPALPAVSTVYLKSGAQLRAEVLSEKADRVVVDLGFSILAVPTDEIERIAAAEDNGTGASEDAAGLYRVEPSRPSLGVKENARRCGEAVVQIRTPTGLGSGFVIHPDGYIVTNQHVISGEYTLSVTLYRGGGSELDKEQFNRVRIVAMDAGLDLALLKIEGLEGRALPTVPLGESDEVAEGQTVFAIGSPLGLERTLSQGIISLRNRPLGGMLLLQTTTQINPGNSGGPLFNLRGEVVGVNNRKAMMVGVEGLNFAIPANTVKSFLKNRDAYAFDPRNANAGFRYLEPPRPPAAGKP